MTAGEKESLCGLMAALFSPPEEEMIEYLQRGQTYRLWEKHGKLSGAIAAILRGTKTEISPKFFWRDLQEEYGRLFSGIGGESISLAESSYKPWTRDPECHLPFAKEKGLFMGDSALHMAAIFQRWGVEVPEQFKGSPDHLLLELEFLSALYGGATDREIKQFIGDHLDWIPQLKLELSRFHAHPFYVSAVEILDFFLEQERERLEIEENGEKSVH